MANKMLIDASHPEETRVVVLRGNRVEEFDFESASKKQLRGNIYLAKVTRVEPSLQAAFVDYGGNRHGFLAFSEIHPDYYQIPVADRQALLEDEARAQEQDAEDEGRPNNNQRRTRRNRRDRSPRPDKRRPRDEENVSGLSGDSEPSLAAETGDQGYSSSNDASGDDAHSRHYDDGRSTEHADTSQEHAVTSHENEHRAHPANAHDDASPASGDSPALARSATGLADDRVHSDVQPDVQEERWAPREVPAQGSPAPVDADAPSATHEQNTDTPAAPALDAGETPLESRGDQPGGDEADDGDDDGEETEEEQVEQLGGDAMEEMPVRAPRMRRQYKIQEVIKRRQVLLVQVVKEERGNKGAALTTYLSLAGRYSVLMPNTARGGGISRKITDTGDRKRLKEIAGELEVPDGMGVILRTAGASRTPQEVKRDFEYLLRMWETVREVTLKSTAPTLVYEEGSLIKRSIRDLFNKDVEEIVVAGEAGHKEARDFMRLLMPSHVKNVHAWDEQQPVFAKYGVEAQLDAMYSNHVTLKSGGYIVINQTEALVAIDVNSGRSTREHNIEDTALRTNLEAADEVARQLRLRDLAGLIVVDFIDMEEHRNNRSVERRMKDALKNDRARIQVGHISHFGLLEMSRQRIRTGVLEGSTIPCPHCTGSGIVRSTASIALHVLRVVEDALIKSATHNIIVRTRTEVALYILNQKRSHLRDIEKNFGVTVIVAADDTLTGAVYHAIERGELASPPVDFTRSALVRIDSITPDHVSEDEEEDEGEDEAANGDTAENVETEDAAAEGATDENDDPRRKRRRRRRRGRGDREPGAFQPSDAPQPPDAALAVMAQIHGDLPATLADATLSDGDSDETEAAEFPVDEAVSGDDAESRRRRRPRRGGRSRGRDGKRFEPEFSSEAPAQAAAAETAEAPPVERTFEPVSASQPEPFGTTPSFAPPLEHVAAIYHPPAPQAVEAHAEPAPPKTPEPPPAYVAPLPEAPVDPDKPKKAGWWQKARQSFGN